MLSGQRAGVESCPALFAGEPQNRKRCQLDRADLRCVCSIKI